MSDARTAVLGRLRAARTAPPPALPDWQGGVAPEGRLDRFRERLTTSHAEVVSSSRDGWPALLAERLQARGLDAAAVLYAPDTPHGRQLAAAWADRNDLRLVPYDAPVETLKDTLVHGVDAGVTATCGGIAETGTLILWPTAEEPRLMSLLPPVHVALVEAGQVHETLSEAMAAGQWSDGMPTNLLLISGPSKTADIEQTLAYGVHGPKDLLVILLEP